MAEDTVLAQQEQEKHLPYQPKELESSFKQLHATDVTQTLSGLAQLTEQP